MPSKLEEGGDFWDDWNFPKPFPIRLVWGIVKNRTLCECLWNC